jgi:tRNA(fMet)-specific endonuclease VapC
MIYLLDSNTCIHYLNGRSIEIARKVKSTPSDQIAVCSIVKAELYFGAERSNNTTKTRAEQDEFFAPFQSLSFDDTAANLYAKIRADLATKGTPIGPNDLMIAAIALANNLTLISHNTREFNRINTLKLEDWDGLP